MAVELVVEVLGSPGTENDAVEFVIWFTGVHSRPRVSSGAERGAQLGSLLSLMTFLSSLVSLLSFRMLLVLQQSGYHPLLVEHHNMGVICPAFKKMQTRS